MEIGFLRGFLKIGSMVRYSFLLLILLLAFVAGSQAQTATRKTDSGWRFGLNIGGAYQGKPLGQKELDPAFGMGWGMTLGRTLYQEPGAFFNLGLRGRFLWEMTKGISTERHYPIGVHPRSGNDKRFDFDVVGQRYQDTVGYIYPNYRQEGRQYDLEVTLGLNRWAEQTNMLFYLFGGVGVVNYQVHTDQLGSDGSVYRYDQRFQGTPSKDQLRKLWDGEYETEVYEGGKIDRFIPSGGLGLIYQITPSLGIGLEHKISFPENEDRFDAVEFGRGFDPQGYTGGKARAYDQFQKTSRQDLYHYTSLRFRWRILSGGSDDSEPESDPSADQYSDHDATDNIAHAEPPEVNITNPGQTPYRTELDSFILKASIKNVVNEENVTLLIDGQEFGDPGLDLSEERLEQRIALEKGGNPVRVRAVNDRGSDADKVLIVRRGDTLPPPKVDITEPDQDPHTSYQAKKGLKANVLNIERKDSIRFMFNGSPHPFKFDSSTGELKAELQLIQGANVVDISARNEKGRGKDEGTIIYRKEADIEPPRVWFSYPDQDPHVVYQPHATLRARVEGIASRYDIKVMRNGSPVNDFNYYPNDGLLTMDPSLDPGNNVFQVKVKDEGGRDEAQHRIVLANEKRRPPVVNFERPASSGKKVNDEAYRVIAFIDHVSSPNQVDLKMNGSARSGFAFNASSGKLIYDARLKPGINHFEVHAANEMGADLADRSIRFEKAGSGPPPSIRIIKPEKDPYRSSDKKPFISARVEHVPDKSGLKLQMNGRPITSFQYDEGSGKLGLQKELVEGRNRISIKAYNGNGSDQAVLTVIHEPQSPPSVNIIDPSGFSAKTHTAKYSLKAKLLRVPSSSDVELTLNGSPVGPFFYDPNSGELHRTLPLQKGVNEVVLKGSNPVGSDEDRVKIRYKEAAAPPSVKIQKPSSNPYQTSKKKVAIKGKVLNGSGPDDLTLKDNGDRVQNFHYLKGGRFKYTMTLQPGSNRFSVKVENSAGQASDSRILHRTTTNYLRGREDGKGKKEAAKEELQSPDVHIEKPSSSETSVDGVRVEATLENAKKIELFVNGDPRTYSLDGDRLIADVPLRKGENKILVRVENEAGSAEDVTMIEFKPVKEAPPKKGYEKGETGTDSGEEVEKEEEGNPDKGSNDDSEGSEGGGQIGDIEKEKRDKGQGDGGDGKGENQVEKKKKKDKDR